jgi:hypothetical protein
MSVPAVLPAVAETLDPLAKLGKVTRWQRPITKVNIHFVTDLILELLDTPS